MAILASDVILIARAVTDQQATAQIGDTTILAVLNPLYFTVRRALGMLVPSLYRKTPAAFTISAGNTQDVTAAPLSLTDYERIWRIRRQVNGTSYSPICVANELDSENVPSDYDFAVLERGTTLELYPSASVAGCTFELSYIAKPTKLNAVGDAVDVPDGVDYVLGQRLAAELIRPRFEEEAGAHVKAAEEAWREAKWYLQQRYGVLSQGLMSAGGL